MSGVASRMILLAALLGMLIAQLPTHESRSGLGAQTPQKGGQLTRKSFSGLFWTLREQMNCNMTPKISRAARPQRLSRILEAARQS